MAILAISINNSSKGTGREATRPQRMWGRDSCPHRDHGGSEGERRVSCNSSEVTYGKNPIIHALCLALGMLMIQKRRGHVPALG